MKVGILTFHTATNYGAVLQCYALQTALEKCGYTVEVINYQNDFFRRFYSPFYMEKKNLRKFAYMLYAYNSKRKRNESFKEFRNQYLHLSQSYTPKDIENADTNYDAIIVGSDQVWNLDLTKDDQTYLLNFVQKAKRFSYAASFGKDSLQEALKPVYEKELSQYKYITVRESSGISIVEELCSVNTTLVPDPTLLLSSNEWDKIASLKECPKEKYICVYKINVSQCYEAAQQLSKKTGYPVVVLKPDKTCPSSFSKKEFASPEEFVGLIKNAEYVVTDSFHGTAFSIIYKKKFFSFLDRRANNKNNRIIDILTRFDLIERIVDDKTEEISIETINNYEEIEGQMSNERKRAFDYLNKISDFN